MKLKSFLKSFKLNESTISMLLGAIVVVVVGLLVVNYFRDRDIGITIPGLRTNDEEEVVVERTHTVAEGENLWIIAEQYFGSGYNWVDIAEENELADAGQIDVGQRLTIPTVEPRETTALEETEVVVGTETIAGNTYTIQRGDNLWDISVRAYGDGYRWVEIARENDLVNPDLIHAGNELVLPR